jgi:hypothetical protein
VVFFRGRHLNMQIRYQICRNCDALLVHVLFVVAIRELKLAPFMFQFLEHVRYP